MKKLFTFVLFSMIAFNAIHAEVTWSLSSNGTLTISGTGKVSYNNQCPKEDIKKIVIGNGVISIAAYAFSDCSALTSVTFGSSVTNIDSYAFLGCPNLKEVIYANGCTTTPRTYLTAATSVTIPNTVTSIANEAFRDFKDLKSINIPNSVTSIGSSAFENCTGLKSISIPSSVITIKGSAFKNCTAFTSVSIPNSVTTMEWNVFENCSGITSATIGNSLTAVENYTFKNCTSLTSVTFGSSVKKIKGNSFENTGFTSITIPNPVTTIETSAFYGCSALASVTFTNSVTDISYLAFSSCPTLKEVIYANGCTTTPRTYLTAATSVTIPNTVTSIANEAFRDFKDLTSITCEASTPPTCGSECFTNVNKSIPLHIPANSVEEYNVADGWKEFTNIKLLEGTETYTVTLDHNKGNGDPEQITVTYNRPMPENIGLVAPTRTGFEFTGYLRNGIYYYDANLKSVRNFDKQEDYTLYANWKARTTTVTLDPQGGQNGTAQVTTTYGKAMPTGENIVAPTRAGYTFGGYFSSVNGKGTQYYNTDMTSKRSWNKEAEEMTLYAKWTPDVFVTDIAISETATDLWIGKTKTLTANVAPANATITAVTWTSSNTAVATVSSKGVVKAIAKGTATITCKATDGSGISKTCIVTVKQPVTSIVLSVNDATLWVGKAKTITATVSPTTATKTSVTWSSSDDQVATVSTRGVIKATGRGTCIITCTAADGYGTKAECEVTVKQQVTSIDFGYETLSVTCGTTKTLTPNIYPSNANVQKLTWKSKNTSVAKVSSEGVLTAVAPGTAQIICTATDGFKKADTITVEVVPLQITDSKPTIAEGTYGIGGISYTRTLTAGKYASFCLPYTVNLNDYTEEFSKVFVPMGMTFLKTNGTLMVMFKNVSMTETISAGKPFVALAAKSGSVSIVNDVKKIVTTLTEPTPTNLDVYDWNGSNGFLTFNPDIMVKMGGTYGKLTGLDSEKYYTVATSGTMSKSASISPYRIYVYKDDNNSNAKITDIIFSFDEDEMATSIEEQQIKNDDSPVFYNLSGQRINKSNAQKGVYIKNGKKYAK